jgi:hypothetical protein
MSVQLLLVPKRVFVSRRSFAPPVVSVWDECCVLLLQWFLILFVYANFSGVRS